jgi:inositol-hexakisphosphate/diphosphoinositol-pentakisphosphate 1-kinase
LIDEVSSNQRESNDSGGGQIKLGICCMEKKLKSRPMRQILSYLEKAGIQIVKWNNETIQNKPIEEWPHVDVLIGFYSSGFPLQKAIAYVDKFKPKMINDLRMQSQLWDRSKIVKILQNLKIPVAKSFVVLRGADKERVEKGEDMTQEWIEQQAEKTRDIGEELAEELANPDPGKTMSGIKKVTSSESMTFDRDERPLVPPDQSPTTEQSELLFEDKEADIKEYDDYILIRGQKLKKPFLEKPLNAEDHAIYIHYSNSSPCGSGYSVLFRKTADKSSQFIPTSNHSALRTEGSYIYEEFLPTDGFDIKVYTVGEEYAHAEARKAPSIDGKVQRDLRTGKEVRYPVNLTNEEKEYARRISMAFKQEICGLDMLRTRNKTYVCDVNGFSFVKTSDKYYEDCANQILLIIFRKLGMGIDTNFPDNFSQASSSRLRPYRPDPRSDIKHKGWELRSIVAVFRHGDRTPKQKMKFKTQDRDFLKLFGFGTKAIKIKKPRELQKVLLLTIEKIQAILTRTT